MENTRLERIENAIATIHAELRDEIFNKMRSRQNPGLTLKNPVPLFVDVDGIFNGIDQLNFETDAETGEHVMCNTFYWPNTDELDSQVDLTDVPTDVLIAIMKQLQ